MGLPGARPETGGQSSWVGVSQECMPPTAAANRPPENAPHTEANAYRGGSPVPDLSLGGSSGNACTLTCLHTDPLRCIQAPSLLPRGIGHSGKIPQLGSYL